VRRTICSADDKSAINAGTGRSVQAVTIVTPISPVNTSVSSHARAERASIIIRETKMRGVARITLRAILMRSRLRLTQPREANTTFLSPRFVSDHFESNRRQHSLAGAFTVPGPN
jgi:hypothetical protein